MLLRKHDANLGLWPDPAGFARQLRREQTLPERGNRVLRFTKSLGAE
ncbi:hypothetical protein GGR20_002663 [Devosia subaequoris]|uniref:Uncharacterized protein n=1 Tax=Devosia subaequoris TaxID=395930 RepID=A0A7W6NCF1_9HYPH|nr:hypothetical protein [Devosia subaequoris]